ncbi:SDR family oxidoreductase [Aspergillus lucknowensis]|uniref:NADP(+)-dependent dehydrogenase n=1 Tax=Aspergillus lucknowensis TaxID=176173 RepID=A0ABR4LIQ9_9EURO
MTAIKAPFSEPPAENSAAGKTVIITGAGSGIGRPTAVSFNRAGAGRIILLGRDETKLQETQKLLSAHSSIYSVSVTDEKGLTDIAAALGTKGILVLSAGYVSTLAPIKEAPTDEWWQSFETNVKGTMIPSKVFLPTANPERAAIIGITSALLTLPAETTATASAYFTSKLAVVKFTEYLAAENPTVFLLQPYTQELSTPLSSENPEAIRRDFPWIHEADFLRGRHVWANWDVQELKTKAENIKSTCC